MKKFCQSNLIVGSLELSRITYTCKERIDDIDNINRRISSVFPEYRMANDLVSLNH